MYLQKENVKHEQHPLKKMKLNKSLKHISYKVCQHDGPHIVSNHTL